MITLAPTESDVLAALRAFLVAVLPAVGADAINQGQQNRVPPPAGSLYVEMWPIQRPRLATNVDDYVDTSFTASISGTDMTVSAVAYGSIDAGATVFGVDVATGTTVVSGPGGVGDYVVSPAQTVTSQKMASGHLEMTQETEIVVQVDLHAATLSDAGNMAATVATAFRDDYAVQIVQGANANVTPLYADDPRESPFNNDQQQVEPRWTVDLHLQANQTVSGIPLQFADAAVVTPVSVDAAFPPS